MFLNIFPVAFWPAFFLPEVAWSALIKSLIVPQAHDIPGPSHADLYIQTQMWKAT